VAVVKKALRSGTRACDGAIFVKLETIALSNIK
jgi:hypothetical protein